MKRLGDEVEKITHYLTELKKVRNQIPATQKQKRVYQDFRHLNHTNLEDHDWVLSQTAYFKTKEVPYCGRCGEGFIYSVDENRNRTAKVCDYCERPRRRLKRLNDLQLPKDAEGMHLDLYEWDSQEQFERVNALVEWMNLTKEERGKAVSPSLYLWGSPGNGKTSILYALAKYATFNDHKVHFTSHTQLIDRIKRTFNGKDDNPLEQWLSQINLLLFDEFGGIGGRANMTDWFKSITVDIIQRMYERWAAGELAIVMTTNLTPEDLFTKALDQNRASASRLQAMFKRPIHMKGHDRRADKKELAYWGVR